MKRSVSGTQEFDAFQANSYFNTLDGLRAISILMVLLHHVPRFQHHLIHTLQENGRYGVSFFFVISGFLICTLFLREERKTDGAVLGVVAGNELLLGLGEIKRRSIGLGDAGDHVDDEAGRIVDIMTTIPSDRTRRRRSRFRLRRPMGSVLRSMMARRRPLSRSGPVRSSPTPRGRAPTLRRGRRWRCR